MLPGGIRRPEQWQVFGLVDIIFGTSQVSKIKTREAKAMGAYVLST